MAQVTQLWPYGGPGSRYGSFDKTGGSKGAGPFTRHAVYGGIAMPYGSFSGKSPGVPFELEQTADAALTGVLGVTGDLEIEVSWEVEAPMEVNLSGVVSVTGDIEITEGVALDLVQTADAALSGVVAVTGDLEFGTSFDVTQTADVALAGVVGVSGDLQFSTDPIPDPVVPRVRFASGRRNYIYKGKRYHNLTNEELCELIRKDQIDVTREDIRVSYKGKKPHPVSKNAWAELQETMRELSERVPEPVDDDEDIEAIMALL